MNFIYIHTHDTGRLAEPYGIAADNPSLMEFAQNAVIFRNMYCSAPTCSPSRASMLTGQAPHSCGMLGLAHRGFSLSRPEEHLSHFLSKNGYYTALFGVQHEASAENIGSLGYREITNLEGSSFEETDLNNLRAAQAFLLEHSDTDMPFFMSFGMVNTHKPWPDRYSTDPDYVIPPYPVADTPENRVEYCQYLESLSVVDRCVGGITEAVRKAGLWDNTIILFTTDHGVAYPNMKCNLYDTGIGVSFLLRIPGYPKRSCSALCTQLDLFPTVCDLLNLEKPSYLQGKSLLPLLNGEEEQIHDYVFSEVTFHATYQPMRSVRSKQFKLIRFFDGGNEFRSANIDAGTAKTLYISTKLSHLPKPKDLFFDLYADPAERVNLADVPEYAEEYSRHLDALLKWQKQTDDPLLRGMTMSEMGRGTVINGFDAPDPQPKSAFVIR